MITEEHLIAFLKEEMYKPMTYQELEKALNIHSAKEFKALLKLLNKLELEGKVVLTRKKRYGLPERMDLVRGTIQAHAKGFAFLIPDDATHPDVYIHANDLKGAMNGDFVFVKVTTKDKGTKKCEGEVTRIISRAITQVVGVYQECGTYGFLLPDNKRLARDLFIPKGCALGAKHGDKVVAQITKYPEGRLAAEAEVIEVLGNPKEAGVDILSIVRQFGLPEAFSEEVLKEAENVPEMITEAEILEQGRKDLRSETIVTIDGEDAKDLDDAVHVKRLENGNYLLGVHIADVSYYVTEDSELDKEAFRRGCSVYLVDRVIPMLPPRLSNGICSLNPQVDRMTLTCEMEFDKHMKRVSYSIFPSVIRTVERMSYTNVFKIIEKSDETVYNRYAELVPFFELMNELAQKLRKKRISRGAIDFDFEEAKIIVDEKGKAIDIKKRERSIAEQLIEEFMLIANETVAEHFHWLELPFIYRTHEEPDPEKMMHFHQLAASLGHGLKGKGNQIHPSALQSLLDTIKGTKEQTVISTMLLRSMKQAKYEAESLGHFGLAAEFYTHFTSPIRRYPDLIVHRLIRATIKYNGTMSGREQKRWKKNLPDIAEQSSKRERVAVDAERETEQMKKAEYMLDKVGQHFEGIISSVTSFGMFIELDNTVEGLIRLSQLYDDYYHFHQDHMILVGEATGNIFRIGDHVSIKVAAVNMEDHTIDFELSTPFEAKERKGKRK